MGKLLFGTFIVGVPAILAWSFAKGTRQESQMMTAAMVLIIFNVFFWTLFEQAGSSLTLFADRNTDRSVFGLFTLSAPQTQNFNPICIVASRAADEHFVDGLAKRGLEPSIPIKFAIALVGVGAGFLFLVFGIDLRRAATTSRSACGGWPAFTYPFARRTVHLAGRTQHDHQAVDRAASWA